MRSLPRIRSAGAALIFAAVAVATGSCGSDSTTDAAAAKPEPSKCAAGEAPWRFGVSLDWSTDSPTKFSKRLGVGARAFVKFAPFPMDAESKRYVGEAVDLIARADAMLVLTLEPHDGLGVVTRASASELARTIQRYEARGVSVVVRFAHEMNGSWYAWGQQPEEYALAFRTVADAVHRESPKSAMMWAPNYGGGYPFSDGSYEAEVGTAAHRELDTNADRILNAQDDPYGPYYPGDDAVDWVGISLYHWGAAHPWGENELPEADKFVAELTGTYNGAAGDDGALPDFYAEYAVDHSKPLAITETAALVSPDRPRVGAAPTGVSIKKAWIDQVFSPKMLAEFDRIAMINWFDFDKFEAETNGRVDWSASRNPRVSRYLRNRLPAGSVTRSCSSNGPGPASRIGP